MVPPNSLPREFPREQTHFIRKKHALLPRHGALNLKLEISRYRTRVANCHGQMLPRYCVIEI